MAVREVSLHDSFRLLRGHLQSFLDDASGRRNSPRLVAWVPETAPVGPEEPFRWSFVSSGSCTVLPDHLQSLDALTAAGLVGKDLDEAGIRTWLADKAGKECAVGRVRGLPSHWTVIQDGSCPLRDNEQSLLISSVREGENVTYLQNSVVVPLHEEGQAETLAAQDVLVVALVMFCRQLHITDLEIRVCRAGDKVCVTWAALQLDETAGYLCAERWGNCRFPVGFGRPELPEEKAVHDLDARTGASLKFTLLNRQGRVWTLIAGGGASVVYTDTICEYGYAKELANYGEYSGDPPEEFVYEYAKVILGVMTSSPEPHGKILLIGGGVANFTDVASTFKGLVKALKEFGSALKACATTVWVRRGGPNYSEGLTNMRKACEDIGIPAHVYGPEAHLTSIVRDALLEKAKDASMPVPDVKIRQVDSAKRQRRGSNSLMQFTLETQAFVYGMQTKAVQRMLDFDTLCGRKTPSVAAIVNPTGEATFEKFMFGSADVLIPVYTSLEDAVDKHGKTPKMLVNFASFRSVYTATMDALKFASVIKTHAIIAEGVPEALTRRIHYEAEKVGVAIIGPATVGGMMPGRFRIGNAGGAVENLLLAKLYRPGSVGYTTKSGGMSNELNNIVALNTDGVREGIAIGGDRWPGLRFLDVLLRFEADPDVKMMVLLGEVGGREEFLVAEALQDGRITKPLVAWCCGTAAEAFDYDVQFGHAGARARAADETAGSKNRALAKAGAHVPRSFDEFGDLIALVYQALVKAGSIVVASEPPVPKLPSDYESLRKKGMVRKPANFVCSIADDRGAEPTYAGVPISEIAKDEELGIGGAISLLWFRKRLPRYVSKFIELCVVATADHGPCVSGAHNTIVAARAGKDLVSSLISGLATIGPRFGGALDDAARMFASALDAGLTAAEFVEKCKQDKTVIMGIGHRVKSLDNPDARVVLIKEYAKANFSATPLLDFALAVEQITTRKKANLILNVDGCIAVCFVDLLRGCGAFTRSEADELVSNGVLNGLFVSSRTIGLVGHFLDQRRLKQPLYRHPYDDVTYLTDS
ncbi:Acly [Symbiodinium sp. CCMP2456]|nr:Acly [Symbiodinium sp. CCMP2456]